VTRAPGQSFFVLLGRGSLQAQLLVMLPLLGRGCAPHDVVAQCVISWFRSPLQWEPAYGRQIRSKCPIVKDGTLYLIPFFIDGCLDWLACVHSHCAWFLALQSLLNKHSVRPLCQCRQPYFHQVGKRSCPDPTTLFCLSVGQIERALAVQVVDWAHLPAQVEVSPESAGHALVRRLVHGYFFAEIGIGSKCTWPPKRCTSFVWQGKGMFQHGIWGMTRTGNLVWVDKIGGMKSGWAQFQVGTLCPFQSPTARAPL
jgi:hypothetical protein